VQERFVDQPSEALVDAHLLVHRVMEARGYPMRDFEAQADLVSVDHPNVVENYRFAHGVHQRAREQQASTEDLREALLRYRSLFSELLDSGDSQTGAAARREQDIVTAQRDTTDSGADRHAGGQDAVGEPDMASRRDGGVS
jgi:hypothetical protein